MIDTYKGPADSGKGPGLQNILCPFCGWRMTFHTRGGYPWEEYKINCPNTFCPVQPETKWEESLEDAIVAFNLRNWHPVTMGIIRREWLS